MYEIRVVFLTKVVITSFFWIHKIHPDLWPSDSPRERLSRLIEIARNDYKLKVDESILVLFYNHIDARQ